MAEVGFNKNYDAFHFDIHKTIAYQIINRYQSFRSNKVGCRPHEIGQTDKKLTPLEERLSQITSIRMTFLTTNPLSITSSNCLWYVSVHQNRLRCMWRMFKILIYIVPFEIFFMTGTALHTNAILQYLVLDKIVIALTATKYLIQFVLFQLGFL